jgi:3-hydroxyisobutyrate dehydrogenase
MNSSSGRCWSSDTYNPYPDVMENVPAARGYTGGFGAELMLKDLGLVTEAAKQAKQPVMMGAVAQQVYQMMVTRGYGGMDFSGVIKMYQRS